MNILWEYIDIIVLVLCFVFTCINTFRTVKAATIPVRKPAAFFLIFGATSIASFIGFGHLFEISFHAVERGLAGTFVFDFRFYSLILMGLVLLSLSVRMMKEIRDWLQERADTPKAILVTMVLIVALSAPAGLFTPIAYVPSIACAVSLLALPFTRKRKKAVTESALAEA